MTEKHPDIFIWSSINTISKNLESISIKLIDYQRLLFQLSTLIDGKYIEKYHFDIDDSTEEIKSYIMIWWSNFVVDDTKISKQTLRRWKRIIRCKEQDIEKIHTKTIEWVDKYLNKWKETQIQYNQAILTFTSIWNAYVSNKMRIKENKV